MRLKFIIFIIFYSTLVTAQNDSLLIAPSSGILSIKNLQVQVDYDPLKTEINYPVLAALGGVYLGAGIGVHIYQRNAWWKDQRRDFHFVNDNVYALGIDKVGHFYAGNLLAHAFSAALEAGNIPLDQSAIYGSLGSFLFELYVEIEDGYGPNWGFSPGDAAADFLGASYSLAQFYYPFLKNFQPRFSYLPSDSLKAGTHSGNIIDDYAGQKYWLSLRVKNLLPSGIDKYWPSFLMLSFGLGVRDLTPNGGGQREFYIALDIDAEEIPLYGKGWQFIKNTLNYFHFPMPGVRITPDAAFFVLCF